MSTGMIADFLMEIEELAEVLKQATHSLEPPRPPALENDEAENCYVRCDGLATAVNAFLIGQKRLGNADPTGLNRAGDWRTADMEYQEYRKTYEREIAPLLEGWGIEVTALVVRQRAVVRTAVLSAGSDGTPDALKGVAEHIGIDQHLAVTHFASMVNPNWRGRYTDARILVLEASTGMGKSTALKKFTYLCDEVLSQTVEKPILLARVDFKDQNLGPRAIAVRIVDSLIDLTDVRRDLGVEGPRLKDARNGLVGRSTVRRQGDQQMEWMGLTNDLRATLLYLCEHAIVVLLLDHFEYIETADGGNWLISSFLTRMRDDENPAADGVVVVIAGQHGLQLLNKWQRTRYLETIFDIDAEDVQRYARLKFHIPDLAPSDAQAIVEMARTEGLIPVENVLKFLATTRYGIRGV